MILSGTVVQLALAATSAYAFISPNPKRELNQNPAEFLNQPGFSLKVEAITEVAGANWRKTDVKWNGLIQNAD